MNTLSYLIYLADIIASVKGVLKGTAFFLLVGTCVFVGVYGIVCEALLKVRYWIPSIILSGFIMFSAALIPSKEAIYLIAASELGEDVYDEVRNSELFRNLSTIVQKETQKIIDGYNAPQSE